MSLINDMLRDLEHRRGGRPLQGHQILSGLDPVGMPGYEDSGRWHAGQLTLMVLILTIPALVWLVYHERPLADIRWPVAAMQASPARGPASTEGIRTGTVTEQELAGAGDEAGGPVQPATPVTDTDSEVMVMNDTGVSVPVWFAQAPVQGAVPVAREVRPRQRSVSASGSALHGGEDLQEVPGPDEQTANRQGSTLAKIDTGADAHTDPAASDNISRAGRFQRDASSADDEVSMRLRETHALLADGHIDAALASFRAVLRQAPGHTGARLELANILVRIGRTSTALEVLEAGLERDPKAWPLALAEARILVARTEIGQAARLLEAHRPELDQAPEYYAYMAGLAQRQGEDDRAISLYRMITARDGARGVWWMGLAISLKRENRSDESLRAFQRAYTDKDLTINLRRYIGTQITKLQRQVP